MTEQEAISELKAAGADKVEIGPVAGYEASNSWRITAFTGEKANAVSARDKATPQRILFAVCVLKEWLAVHAAR